MWMMFTNNSYNNVNGTWYFLLLPVVFAAIPTVFIVVQVIHTTLHGKTEHRFVTYSANKERCSLWGIQLFFLTLTVKENICPCFVTS